MLVGSDGDQCVQASLVNGIDRLGYRDEALEVARRSKVPRVRDFRDLSSWIQENLGRYQISTQKDKRKYEWDDVRTAEEGVWLVNLIGTDEINHVVCNDSSTKQILDGEEKYPMAFNDESIKCCVGDRIAIKKIAVRKLVRKPVSKRKRSSSTVEKKEVKEVEVIEISDDEIEVIDLCD